MARIFIIEDDITLSRVLADIIQEQHHRVNTFVTGTAGLNQIYEQTPDLVLLDLKLPDTNGIHVLERIKKYDESIQVIILTAHGDVRSAVQAMRIGAYDYLNKPFDNEELTLVIEKALQAQRSNREIEALKQRLGERVTARPIIAEQSVAMKQILLQVKEVATTNLTIVLQGESGTGKEVLAHLIHQYSYRRDKSFIAVDCSSLPETLVESELFGYERGAFTGADRRKLGQFELASEGTIFLDEIGNLTTSTQAKLLRVLQEKQIQRLGGKKTIDVDVRIIAATNVVLDQAVKKGTFREDLYYRLTEFVIPVPPLRERKEDIPLFALHFCEEGNKEFYKTTVLSDAAIECLVAYNWPGNIRELRNVIKRAVLLTEREILPEHLQISVRIPTSLQVFTRDKRESISQMGLLDVRRSALKEVERNMIQEVLQKMENNKARAAAYLKISRQTLYKKLRSLGLI